MMLQDFKQALAVGLSLALITTSSYGYRNSTQFRNPARVAPPKAHR